MADDRILEGDVDLISTLPDVILQHILCFNIPIKLAITTSLLSRRWRHVWCEVPSIFLDADTLTAASVNETLNRYTAPKAKSFHLKTTKRENIPHIDRWIKCAMSHNVENLSLDFSRTGYEAYKLYLDPFFKDHKLPDFFYNSSCFKQLNIKLRFFCTMVSGCTVSWTSLQKLSLSSFGLSDESMAKILSGCPVLENLKLYHIHELNVLDLSKSLCLRTLEVRHGEHWLAQIVAPHIHRLKLLNSHLSCTLVDVSSLTKEARLEISCVSMYPDLAADFLQIMALKMLEKLKNAEKLSFGGNFILILSLAEIRGVSFPMLKAKKLTLETVICQYVIPGIERLLQNSPDLEKLIVRGRNYNTIPEEHFDLYLKLNFLYPDHCWRSKDGFSWNKSCWNVQPKHVASFVELVFINTNKLDKMVLVFDELYPMFNFKEVVSTLPPKSNVTIVSSINNPMTSEEW